MLFLLCDVCAGAFLIYLWALLGRIWHYASRNEPFVALWWELWLKPLWLERCLDEGLKLIRMGRWLASLSIPQGKSGVFD